MNKTDVIALLEQHQNPRGIAHWQKMKNTRGLRSYGIGLTVLRKLAKQVGRDHELALTLWESDIYDAKVIALLIDEPKAITFEQAEKQVDELNAGMLNHVFCSCDATLAKAPIAFDLANQWLESDETYRRRSAYGLLYELSKNKRNKALTDEYFSECIQHIDERIHNLQETPGTRLAMGTALMGIGKRNLMLNQQAIKVAEKAGPIDFNEDGGKCDPFDVLKHLTNEGLQNKLRN